MQLIQDPISYQVTLLSEAETLLFSSNLAKLITPPATIYFIGDLGAGKTTMIRGLLQGYGVTSFIKSPSYTIVESYNVGDMAVYHFDLYRLSNSEELEFMGFREYLSSNAIILLEWADKLKNYLPGADVEFIISDHIEINRRDVCVKVCKNYHNSNALISSLVARGE